MVILVLASDADLDVDALLDGYLDARYGDVADLAAEYVDLVAAAGRALFVSGRGEFDDEERVAEALDLYRDGWEIIGTARERAKDGTAAELVCRRLEANAEYAVADTEISFHELRGDDADAAAACECVRELATEHAFDGIVLDGRWTLFRTDPEFDTEETLTDAEQELFERYCEGYSRQ